MTHFWLAVVAMLTGVAGVMFWPLIALHAQSGNSTLPASVTPKKAKQRAAVQSNAAARALQAATHQQRNIEIFKERLNELAAEKTQGTLDALAFEQLKLELEKSLLNDVSTNALPLLAESVTITLKHWLMAILMTLAVIIWSISLYAALGRSDDYNLRLAMQAQGTLNDQGDDAQAMATTDQNAPDLNKAIELLKEKVKQDPKNIGRWFLLANSYAATQQYAKSAETFLEIEKIVPKDSPDYPAIKGSYAQALYLANDEKITEAVKAAIAEALSLDPNEPNALVLKGVESFEQAAYKQAIGFWEQAKTKANPNLIAQFIDPSISAAQAKLGITAPTIANKDTSAATVNATAKIQVTVDIAPELKSRVSNDHIVFVFARPANSKMPLAAERLTVKDLPATITLDDSKAAMPTAKLSSVAEVDVIARISLSGQAIPQDGDLFATQEHVNVNGSAPIRLLINQVVGATTAAAEPAASATLRLTVDIAPQLKANVSPEQTVFIFAKPPGGKMPLAVERLTVKDLPANVVLDDSKAAMPTATLSAAETVDLTARISLSGQAIAQTGDLFASQEQVNIKQTPQPIPLLINQVMP